MFETQAIEKAIANLNRGLFHLDFLAPEKTFFWGKHMYDKITLVLFVLLNLKGQHEGVLHRSRT